MKMFLLSCLVCVSFVHTGCEDGDDSPVTTSSSFVVDRDSVKDFSAFLKELEETASQSKEGVKVSIGAQELSFFRRNIAKLIFHWCIFLKIVCSWEDVPDEGFYRWMSFVGISRNIRPIIMDMPRTIRWEFY